MNRRTFLKRMFAAGIVLATPKIIIDLAANTFRNPPPVPGGITVEMLNRHMREMALRKEQPAFMIVSQKNYERILEYYGVETKPSVGFRWVECLGVPLLGDRHVSDGAIIAVPQNSFQLATPKIGFFSYET